MRVRIPHSQVNLVSELDQHFRLASSRLLLKLSDSSPGSPSDTLLRLSPNYWSHFSFIYNEASSVINFHDLTGSKYKLQEHIHRDMLIRDY